MPIKNRLLNLVFSNRLKEIDRMRKDPHSVQEELFGSLMRSFSLCEYGRSFEMKNDSSYSYFAKSVPIVSYDQYEQWINRTMNGEKNLIWTKDILWYSKSSGTTSSVSKFLPVPDDYLQRGHLQGGKDVLALFMHNYPNNNVLSGKTLTLGGSVEQKNADAYRYSCGDISAIMMNATPWYAKINRVPSLKIAVTKNFNEKIEGICRECVSQNLTSFAGVPSWNMVMLEKILEYTGKRTISEVWENMELFVHGGISFEPYRTQYKRLIPSDKMKYMETYNASEGFFGIQDDPLTQDMLLMMDYDIFYEFLPMESFDDFSTVVPVEGVEVGKNYALIISTAGGLWRYMIGDTVKFTSVYPHKIVITGRTKLYMNAFGEEVIIENADKSLKKACEATSAEIKEYMAAPIFMSLGSKGQHQWVIEFATPPVDMDRFTQVLDSSLMEANSDYAAKRFNNTTVYAPKVDCVPPNSFHRYMESCGRLGGQNKVPRLSNTRDSLEKFLAFVESIR